VVRIWDVLEYWFILISILDPLILFTFEIAEEQVLPLVFKTCLSLVRAKKAWISLPRDKGVKSSIIEERERTLSGKGKKGRTVDKADGDEEDQKVPKPTKGKEVAKEKTASEAEPAKEAPKGDKGKGDKGKGGKGKKDKGKGGNKGKKDKD